jgi:hypothetical protein
LSLDENDNAVDRFLVYPVSAVQTVWPGFGETASAAARSPQPPPAETILALLVNELVGREELVVVLDDYHAIKLEPIHAAVNFLIEHLPPQIHLVIATRSDPPLGVSRLRSRLWLTEVRSAQLRFSRAEAAEFLAQVMGLSLSDEVVAEQVIGYGTPNLVLDFIHKLPPGQGQKVFIFRTAGGVAPINYNASKVMIRRLSRKGYDVGYEWLFSVSSNWIVRFETAVIQQLVAATQAVTVSDAEFIDATGKSLMPGLIDTHLHIFYSFEKGEQAYRALHKNQIPRQMANFLRYGVTTIKSLDDPMLQILETLANRELLPIGAKNLKGLAETGEGDGVAQ